MTCTEQHISYAVLGFRPSSVHQLLAKKQSWSCHAANKILSGSCHAIVSQWFLRQLSRSGQAVVRHLLGSGQAVVRQWSDSRQAVVRQWSGSGQAVVRQSSGSHQAVVRQWSGSCQAVHTGPKMSVSSIGGNVIRTRKSFVKQRQGKEDNKSSAIPIAPP